MKRHDVPWHLSDYIILIFLIAVIPALIFFFAGIYALIAVELEDGFLPRWRWRIEWLRRNWRAALRNLSRNEAVEWPDYGHDPWTRKPWPYREAEKLLSARGATGSMKRRTKTYVSNTMLVPSWKNGRTGRIILKMAMRLFQENRAEYFRRQKEKQECTLSALARLATDPSTPRREAEAAREDLTRHRKLARN